MRLIAKAYPPSPCAGTLSFADSTGNPIGPSLAVNLYPGQSQALDLDSSTLSLQTGQRIEVQPIVTLASLASSDPTAPGSACGVSSEVFDRTSGRTGTFQTADVR